MSRSVTFIFTILTITIFALKTSAQTLEELMQSGKVKQEMKTGLPEFEREVAKEEAELPEAPTRPMERKRGVQDRAIDPDEYMVGPGDKLTIYLWGTLDKDYTLTVTPEGQLLIPTVGVVDVTNKTLTTVKKEVVEKVKKRYEKVDVDVILVGLREFRIHVFGQVRSQGSYIVTGVDRVSDLIDLVGGFSRKVPASRRSIEVRHQDGTVTIVDLAFYERTGEIWRNPYLRMGDIVYVPVAKGAVTIYGRVHFPGDQEFKDGDTIEDHLILAGGVIDGAAIDSVEIARFTPDGKRMGLFTIDLREHMASLGATQNFALQKDDQIIIRPIPEWRVKNSVTIMGEIMRPGLYPIEGKEGIMLTELVKRAGGFLENASLIDATVVRGKASNIVDAEYERLKRIPYADMTEEERKYIATKQRERQGIILVDFRKLFVDGDLSEDIVLLPGDAVNIPIKRETIGISGRVKQPGLVMYMPGAKVDDYLAEAGGFAWNADKGGMRLVKAEAGLILKPEEVKEIHPGDTIWVPAKEPVRWWRGVQEVAEVAAGFAPMIISILVTTR
jgi:protein involved in polysaccharide export with SLBB domain